MGFEGIDLIFPREYLQAALMVSLLSVWVLVGLFYYLNHYTRREYFTVWTAAWLFYALWLTLSLTVQDASGREYHLQDQAVLRVHFGRVSLVGQPAFSRPARPADDCLACSCCSCWSGLSSARMSSVRICCKSSCRSSSCSAWAASSPAFASSGCGSRMPFVGAGMLSLGFLLWGVYLATTPCPSSTKISTALGFSSRPCCSSSSPSA